MPRRAARACGQLVYHVLNRAVQHATVFVLPDEYREFLRLLREAADRFAVRVLAYTVMPNHWHLVLWPTTDRGLSVCMHWLTARHAQRWRDQRGSRGRGAVYQGRFKAIAVQTDGHLLRLCRYVERNPLRARLVTRAEDWPWSSASTEAHSHDRPVLAEWPLPKPENWSSYVNDCVFEPSLAGIRRAIRRNEHLGDAMWRDAMRARLDWRSGRGPGRPRTRERRRPTNDSVIDFGV